MADTFQFGIKHAVAAATILAAAVMLPALLKTDEGDKLKAYRDSGGIWTACGGVEPVPAHSVFTQAECDAMNAEARNRKLNGVASMLAYDPGPVVLTALTSFAYNIGLGAFHKSRTLRLVNSHHIPEGCKAMMDFHRAGGKVSQGLINRRNRDINFCLKGVSNVL